ncbi:hypothetical protein [Flavobacterium reichenbachii]|uniref:Uncharacterized protein n=1 Tax=Flavobacterium reichenbachii TaxID=362418 RepID=A0A085ZRQ7_9FLAO|nr:hypothetical protein [Flavobacterium reichenbachii]KFF07121.1 hypothetical protein IW19_17095 [Flavobacterium reichenbachii]OXB13382.1 hypothetical protein B0A68_16670 [Flavobacterium reichenbachii]
MSFHIYIKNKQKIKYDQLLNNKHLPAETKISFGINPQEPLDGYSKFYLPKLSSRGVAVTTNPDKYDVEVNVGATKDDWRLAVKISLALGEINDSTIEPEFDDEISLDKFEKNYNEKWIEEVKHLSMESFIHMIQETGGALTFMGCIRHYYAGDYIINKLSQNIHSPEMLNDRLIEEIRKIQYLEDQENDIEFPSVRIMDFPDEKEEKSITIFPANFKVLLPKADYIFLIKKNEAIVKVAFDDFIKYIAPKAKRVDEFQYIIYPVQENEHYQMLLHFKSIETI